MEPEKNIVRGDLVTVIDPTHERFLCTGMVVDLELPSKPTILEFSGIVLDSEFPSKPLLRVSFTTKGSDNSFDDFFFSNSLKLVSNQNEVALEYIKIRFDM